MQRLIKSLTVILIVLMLVSLIGCTSSASQKDTDANHKVKTAELKKEKDKKDLTDSKKQQSQNQSATTPNKETTSADSAAKSTQNSSASPNNSASSQSKAIVNNSSATTVKSNQNASGVNSPVSSANQQPNSQALTSATTQSSAATKPQVQTVHMTIIGPKDRDINKDLKVEINDGDTVLKVLFNGIGEGNVSYTGSGSFAYVKGIFGVSQFDYGQKSGWKYSLNGTVLSMSAGAAKVKAGDQIEWKYTENY